MKIPKIRKSQSLHHCFRGSDTLIWERQIGKNIEHFCFKKYSSPQNYVVRFSAISGILKRTIVGATWHSQIPGKMHPQRSQKGAADVKRLRCRLPAALSPNCNPSHLQRFTGLCAGDKARREESHKLCKLAPFVLHLDPPGAPPRSTQIPPRSTQSTWCSTQIPASKMTLAPNFCARVRHRY